MVSDFTAEGVLLVHAVVNLLASLFPALVCCLSPLAVRALEVLNVCLVLLRLYHVVILVLSGVGPEPTVRADRLLKLGALNTIVDLVAHVPVPHTIEVNVAHLVSVETTHDLAVLQDLALEVVHGSLLFNAYFVPASYPVLFILKLAPAADQMDQGAPQGVEHFVLVRLVRDHSAVLELNPFPAFDNQVD